MSINVPSQYAQLMQQASTNSGVPYNVVIAQINTESGFNPGAVSPTGAEGIAQFEPGTWSSYGTGSPFNPTDAMQAYAKYMKTLLNMEGGNLENALAAYNAGPGDVAGGMGYAQQILAEAGQSNIKLTTSTGSPVSSASTTASITDPSSWLPSILSSFTGSLEKPLADIFERGALILFGAVLVLVGLWRMTSGSNKSKIKQLAPAAGKSSEAEETVEVAAT